MAFTINGNKCNTYAEQVTINMRNIQKLDDKYRKKVKGINKHLTAIDDCIDEINKILEDLNVPADLDERLKKLEGTIEEHTEKIDKTEEDITSINKTLEDLDTIITEKVTEATSGLSDEITEKVTEATSGLEDTITEKVNTATTELTEKITDQGLLFKEITISTSSLTSILVSDTGRYASHIGTYSFLLVKGTENVHSEDTNERITLYAYTGSSGSFTELGTFYGPLIKVRCIVGNVAGYLAITSYINDEETETVRTAYSVSSGDGPCTFLVATAVGNEEEYKWLVHYCTETSYSYN